MSHQPVNSMPPTWCAARVAEARAWRDANSQRTPGWQHVHELLSQLDAPPAAAEAQGLGAGVVAHDLPRLIPYGSPGLDLLRFGLSGKEDDLSFALHAMFRQLHQRTGFDAPLVSQLLFSRLDAIAARLATLEAAGAAGAGREVELRATVEALQLVNAGHMKKAQQVMSILMQFPEYEEAREVLVAHAKAASPAPKQQPEAEDEREVLGRYETSGLPVYEGDDYVLDVEGCYLTRTEAEELASEAGQQPEAEGGQADG